MVLWVGGRNLTALYGPGLFGRFFTCRLRSWRRRQCIAWLAPLACSNRDLFHAWRLVGGLAGWI